MIPAVHFDGETRYLSTPDEVSESLDTVLRPGVGDENHVIATWLVYNDEKTQAPVSFLDVCANLEKGLGGVVWFAGGEEAARIEKETGSDMGHYFWVSDSGTLLDPDPEVLSDHYAPSYFDPRGVISIEAIRNAVESFCRSNGKRPSGIGWVAGNQNGTRFD
ncbi:Imm1 family immunity protein [Streptomyces sp. NPDC006339]|uniref:Imm1 family immunity protein n=1 Tax=Streptomyces sp. NPDC006339 TaxID=3156755 RepID=UPI0033AD4F98